jgi:hypothetical protein
MFRSIRVLTAVLLVAVGTPWVPSLLAQKKGEQKPDPAAQAQAQEYQALSRVADVAMSGQAAPSDFPIQFHDDFLRAQAGRDWVPIILTLDPAKVSGPAALYLRVAPRGMTTPPAPQAVEKNDKDKKKDKKNDAKQTAAPQQSPYPFEDAAFLDLKPSAPGQPIRVMRGVAVAPGTYDLYVVVRERAAAAAPAAPAPKTSVLKQPLDAPNYSNGELSTSSVILADRVEQLPSPIKDDQQAEHPYTFGQTEFVVSPDRKFSKSQELIVLLQIYNPMLSPEKKFNLEALYTFYQQTPEGEKRFNSTEPQAVTSETMGGLDPSSGDRSIQTGQGIPLQSFPAGNYRLEVKITDKLSTKVLTQNVNFTVTS